MTDLIRLPAALKQDIVPDLLDQLRTVTHQLTELANVARTRKVELSKYLHEDTYLDDLHNTASYIRHEYTGIIPELEEVGDLLSEAEAKWRVGCCWVVLTLLRNLPVGD